MTSIISNSLIPISLCKLVLREIVGLDFSRDNLTVLLNLYLKYLSQYFVKIAFKIVKFIFNFFLKKS